MRISIQGELGSFSHEAALQIADRAYVMELGEFILNGPAKDIAATQRVAAGIDVDTAARRMGHTKEVMLASYVLGADDRSIAAAQTIESRRVAQGLPLGNILGGDPETTRA